MAPTLLGVRVYPLFVAIAALAGLAATLIAARRRGVPLARLLALELVLLAAGFGGAKLFWLWERGALAAPWSVPFTIDGLRYPGGILAVLLAVVVVAPRLGISVAEFGDLVAPAVAVAMSVIRIGCLLQGCCFGPPSGLPWAIEFPMRSKAWTQQVSEGLIPRSHPHSLAVHPLQIYFGLWSLLVAIVLFRLQRRPHRPGDVLLLFLILHEGGKAALETLRVPAIPALQIASLTGAVIAAGIYYARRPVLEEPAVST